MSSVNSDPSRGNAVPLYRVWEYYSRGMSLHRLIDQLRSRERIELPFVKPVAHHVWQRELASIRTRLREEIPVILIDDVARFCFEAGGISSYDSLYEFPCL